MKNAYQELAQQALAEWLRARTREVLYDLARVLGCACLRPPLVPDPNHMLPVTAEDEEVVKQSWLIVLQQHDATTTLAATVELHILEGLLTNNRWRELVQSEQDAYVFLGMIARYLRCQVSNGGTAMPLSDYRVHGAIGGLLRWSLSDWIQPRCIKGELTERDLACAFFGDVWCDLIYDVRENGSSLVTLMDETAPPFLPGRISSDNERVAMALPALE
jgi:hypothetical protein